MAETRLRQGFAAPFPVLVRRSFSEDEPGHDKIDNNESRSAVIPATGRDSGIPFDRQNLVFAGAVASTVELPHRRPVVFGKSGKRRAYTPAAPGESLGIRPALKQKTGP